MKKTDFKKIFKEQVFLELSPRGNKPTSDKFNEKIKTLTNSLIEISILEIEDDNTFMQYLNNYFIQRKTYIQNPKNLVLNTATIDNLFNGKLALNNIEIDFFFNFSKSIDFYLLHNKNSSQYIPAIKSNKKSDDSDLLVCAGIIISLSNNIFRAHGMFYTNDIKSNPYIN